MTLDWPNLVAGGVLSLLLVQLQKIVSATYKRMTGVKPTFSITGTWYSAEYDIKSADPDQKNTILKVELKRSWTGRITIQPSQVLQLANEKRPTSWIAHGEMYGMVRYW